MARIVVKNLSKNYGETQALIDLNLDIRDREFVCLLGPTGCGKTTTLKCIAGLESPTRGEVYLDDVLVNDIPAKDRGVGLVFQHFALFHHLTVYHNLAFGLSIKGSPKDEIKKEVKNIADLLQLHEILDRKAGTLALDEMQRVAIGRAILGHPKVFLLDEPLSTLDAALRVRMRAELKRLQKEVGQTLVYVTHDQVEAMSMADRIAVMDRARLQQFGSPRTIYDEPANKFVAGFIGSPQMNFIASTLTQERESMYLGEAPHRIDLTRLGDLLKDRVGTELVLGARPEDIEIAHERKSRDFVETRVEIVEPLGSETIVYMSLGENPIRVTAPSNFKAEMGDTKYIRFDMDKTHIFDKKSEQAIV